MRLLRDLVLVKLAPPKTTTASGLLLAPAIERPSTYGKVVQVGPQVRDVTVGAIVAFSPEKGECMDDYFPTPHLMIAERELELTYEH